MKLLTMVMRCGLKDAKHVEMTYNLIAEDYSLVRISGVELETAIRDKKVSVTNMGIGKNGLTVTNGAANKYTLLNVLTNQLEGKRSPVVLNRIEVDGGLAGYTIFSTEGIIRTITVEQAVDLHASIQFANGKLRHTSTGTIIQSIDGNYPIRTVEVKKAKKGVLVIDIVFTGSAIKGSSSAVKHMGIMINCDNAAGLANIYDKLVVENNRLISSIKEINGGADTSTLEIKPTGKLGLYGVFPMDTVLKLIKAAGNKVTVSIGDILMSTVDYTDGVVESRLRISADSLQVVSKTSGTESGDRYLKRYSDVVIGKLREVEIVRQ